ncbi:MAG: hypothetical protein J5379_10430 [Clostridiales bacterium]|nr:hypothetical protein [Clostridiales bacterium]
MSKTSSAVVCETNQIQGQNQENVFFHSLFRVPEEFADEYVRSAKSTAPIQICACFSAQGEDTLAAMTLQVVLKKMQEITAQTQLMSVLDYESFTTQVVNLLNNTVCQESIRNNGARIRVSMSMVIIEGDTLRVMNIGNTHIWLYRQGKLISLTENQTVAHRYVQMGAIPKEAEYMHEGKNELTQYLGRFAQDGEVIPDKKVHLKLQDGDDIVMIGTGLDQCLPIQKLGAVIARPTQPETKASEIIQLGINNGVKFGLTALVMRIESTLLLPGDADIEQAAVSNDLSVAPKHVVPDVPVAPIVKPASSVVPEDAPTIQSEELRYQMNQVMGQGEATADPVGSNYDDDFDDEDFDDDEDEIEEPRVSASSEKTKTSKKKSKTLKYVLIGLLIFVISCLVGYLGMYVLFNAGHWTGNLKSITSETTSESNEDVSGQVVYALYDDTALYVEESLDSQSIDILSRGEAVTLLAMNENFAKVRKENGLMGYVPLEMISDEDPTAGETSATEFYDPTPVPTTTEPKDTSEEPADTTETEAPSESTTESTEESSEATSDTSASDPSESSSEPTSESTSESTSEKPSESSESTSEKPSESSSEQTSESSESSSESSESSEESSENTESSEATSETPAPADAQPSDGEGEPSAD